MARIAGIKCTLPLHGTIVNYLTGFEGNEVQNLIEDEVAAGNRWDVNITTGAKEYTGRIEAELVSGLPFYSVLGKVTGTVGQEICTITPQESIPLATISASSEAGTIRLNDCKCDRLRVNWAAGEFTSYEAEFVCENTLEPEAIGGACTWTYLSPTGASVAVAVGGSTLTELQSGNLEIVNNLEARYACGLGKNPQTIREQRLEVSGALTVGQADVDKFTTGKSSINIKIKGIGTEATGNMEIIIGSVWFDELPEEFSGHDVYEVEFTWKAQPIVGGDIIEVRDKSLVTTW